MSSLTPLATLIKEEEHDPTFADVVNDIAAAEHPNPPNPHTFSLTALQLLPKRLEYRRLMAPTTPQELVVMADQEIVGAAQKLCLAMWGIVGVEESERAEAAAILEAVISPSMWSGRNDMWKRRWMCDDDRRSGRVFDRFWGIETSRNLIPFRYAAAGYTGPSLVYDVLINRVRRIQIQDQARVGDAEDNLGVWGREMNVTKRLRGRGDVTGSDDEDEELEEYSMGKNLMRRSQRPKKVMRMKTLRRKILRKTILRMSLMKIPWMKPSDCRTTRFTARH